MNASDFARKFLLEEVIRMEAAHVPLHLLLAMTQGIETAGALLDNKPFKAKDQGRKRFQLALRKLFPKQYLEANNRLDLYSQLRSHMAHCMLPATTICIVNETEKHLVIVNGQMHIDLAGFFSDYRSAMNKLVHHLESGTTRQKTIMYDGLKVVLHD